MKKLNTLIAAALCLCSLCALCAAPAHALEYNFNAPGGPEYGKPTSIEPVATADRCETPNVDVSKNAALIPPGFGSAGAYTLNTGVPLTPNLAPSYMPGEGAAVGGSGGITVTPPDLSGIIPGRTASYPGSSAFPVGYTAVTSDLYYSDGSLGTLRIPSIGLTVSVYEGTDSAVLARGAGHFSDTSIWDGNCAIASHNRGVNFYFAKIHTLSPGDTVILTTKLGTRTYAVTSVTKISVNDISGLETSSANMITLYTCVSDHPEYRWCVRGVELAA